MKIELTLEQFGLLLSLLTHAVEQYERDAAALMQLRGRCEAAEEIALERFRASQDAAELVSLLAQCEQEGDHA